MRKIQFLILFFCVILIAQTSSAQETVRVPFELDNGQIIVDVNYKKKLPLKMVVSNFYCSFIDTRLTYVRKTITLGNSYQVGATGRFILVSPVEELTIGDKSVPELQMYWNETLGAGNRPRQNYHGVLGYDFFITQVIQIDYPNNILKVFKGDAGKSLFKDAAPSDSKAIVKIKTSTEYGVLENTYVTTEDILVDGKKAKVLLNINENFYDNNVEKKKVKIGGIEVEDAILITGDSKKYDYVLGVDFMKNFVVTFNFKNKQFMIEKNN